MKHNYYITHMDISRLGYYFLDAKQKKLFLNAINNELAERIGEKLMLRLPLDKRKLAESIPSEEIYDFFDRSIPDLYTAVAEIKAGYLSELEEKRKQILISGCSTLKFRSSIDNGVE